MSGRTLAISMLVCVWAAALIPVPAQSLDDHAVSGIVLDPSEAVVAGAAVSLQRGQEAWERTTLTDAAGTFRFDGISAGTYQIQVKQNGFKPYGGRVRVRARAPAPVRIVLAIAELQQEITVSSAEGQANTEIAENLDVVRLDSEQLEQLPILGNDVVGALSKLLDMASLGTSGATLIIDGMPSTKLDVPVSAIQEVRINQNPYSAEFARPGNARIEIITRSGSSKYHGSLSLLLRDHHLDARNAFAAERPTERRRLFDGYISGPLGHSKKTSFVVGLSRDADDKESNVYAYTSSGLLRQNFPKPTRSTLASFRLTRQINKGSTMSLRYGFFDWSSDGGVGGFDLPEVGWNAASRKHTLQYSYRAVMTPGLINELSVRMGRENSLTQSLQPGMRIAVLDAFNGGGGQVSSNGTDSDLDATDVVSWARGKHLVKAGVSNLAFGRQGLDDRSNFDGTFYFSSLADYGQGRPFSFVRRQGDSSLAFLHSQAGLFVQDDIRVRPNLSMGFGLRYDWQNHLRDFNNFAPRFALAFAPRRARKIVFRGGAGIFYDVVGPGNIADVLRFDGRRLRQIVLDSPGYPDPDAGPGTATLQPTSIVRFAPDVRSPYTLQFSFGMEKQLSKSTSVTATYTGSRGVDLFRSRDLNAPPPPLYDHRPDAAISVLRQIESSAGLKAHSMRLAFRGNVTRFFNGSVQYTLAHASNDSSGINSYPADQYNLSGEWSRAEFDRRHYVYLYGTINAGKYFNLGVVFSATSGHPYTLVTGRDDNHDSRATDRLPGVPRNGLSGPGSANLDLRWSRQFPHRKSRKEQGPSFNLSLDAFNVLNRVNESTMVGNLSSPFFGRAVSALPARRIQATFRLSF